MHIIHFFCLVTGGSISTPEIKRSPTKSLCLLVNQLLALLSISDFLILQTLRKKTLGLKLSLSAGWHRTDIRDAKFQHDVPLGRCNVAYDDLVHHPPPFFPQILLRIQFSETALLGNLYLWLRGFLIISGESLFSPIKKNKNLPLLRQESTRYLFTV